MNMNLRSAAPSDSLISDVPSDMTSDMPSDMPSGVPTFSQLSETFRECRAPLPPFVSSAENIFVAKPDICRSRSRTIHAVQ